MREALLRTTKKKRKVEIDMKKIISSFLAVLMLVSLCTVFVAADGELATEAQHELRAVVMLKGNNAFRFIFSMTKSEMATWEGIDVDNIDAYGYEISWGITDKAEHNEWADFKEDWAHGQNWGFDDNGNLYYEISSGTYSVADNYAKVKDGSLELFAGLRNFQSAEDAEARGKDVTKVLYDANVTDAHPDLKVNCLVDGNGACMLKVVAEENYTPEVPETDPVTDPVTPPATADFSAAIVAVAVLALGATVVVAKKKH